MPHQASMSWGQNILNDSDLGQCLPCGGSWVWGVACHGCDAWLVAGAHWRRGARHPPSQWPWYPTTKYPPANTDNNWYFLCTGQRYSQQLPFLSYPVFLQAYLMNGYEVEAMVPMALLWKRQPSWHYNKNILVWLGPSQGSLWVWDQPMGGMILADSLGFFCHQIISNHGTE